MEIIYKESANFTDSYDLHLISMVPLNLTEMVPVIGMEGWCHMSTFFTHKITWHGAYAPCYGQIDIMPCKIHTVML